jgi:Na+/alanine symporter
VISHRSYFIFIFVFFFVYFTVCSYVTYLIRCTFHGSLNGKRLCSAYTTIHLDVHYSAHMPLLLYLSNGSVLLRCDVGNVADAILRSESASHTIAIMP